jgi:DNA-binding NarL/FixJ family response regulator
VHLCRSRAGGRISVKPSAKPTLVRTQHLPPAITPVQGRFGVSGLSLAHAARCHRRSLSAAGRPAQTTEGIRAALQIRQRFPAVGVLLLSTFTEIDEAVELFTATASRVGYLLKDSVANLDQLTDALTRIDEAGIAKVPTCDSTRTAARRAFCLIFTVTQRNACRST